MAYERLKRCWSMSSQKEVIIEALWEQRQEAGVPASRAEIVAEASGIVYSLLHTASFAMVRRIAIAVGSRNLTAVYDRVREEGDTTPARELVHLELALEQLDDRLPMEQIRTLAGQLERGDPRAYQVLRHLVLSSHAAFRGESGAEAAGLCSA